MSVAIPSRLVRKHSFSENRGPAPANHHLTINVVLKIQNAEWLEKKLKEASDPDSPNFGKYATMEEINRLTEAPAEHMEKVVAWLESHGVEHINTRSNDVQFSVTVGEAQRLFNARLDKFGIPNDGDNTFMVRRAGELQIPADLKDVVDFVVGI
jgi:subtilase family serine protease